MAGLVPAISFLGAVPRTDHSVGAAAPTFNNVLQNAPYYLAYPHKSQGDNKEAVLGP